MFFELGKIARNKFNYIVFTSTAEDSAQFDTYLKIVSNSWFVDIASFGDIYPHLLSSKFYNSYKEHKGDLSYFIEKCAIGKFYLS